MSLAVRKGEILTILGPSGCGKTTTLKIIAGFIEPDEGSVLMEGRAVDRLSSHERGAAMVFQNYALFPHLTVQQNVAFGLRMRRLPKAEIAARRSTTCWSACGSRRIRDRYPKELSGGQQQRVALARALIIKPKVLLLDEPFSSLDAKLRKQLRDEFLEIHRNFHITSVFVTHDLEEAFALSDKVAVMNAGVVEQFGAPAKIFSSPRSRFVADFVGHKNILEGTIVESARRRRDHDSCRRPDHAGPAGAAPGPRWRRSRCIGCRSRASRSRSTNCYEARSTHVAYLGPFMQISVRSAGSTLESTSPRRAEIETLRVGDRVHAGWDARDVILVPGEQS